MSLIWTPDSDEELNIVYLMKEKSPNNILAIGDIHGMMSKLSVLLPKVHEHLEEHEKNIVIFLGDYIDRGPESKEVIESVIELQEKYPERVFGLMGNHEHMLLDVVKRPKMDEISTFCYNGGDTTFESYTKYHNTKDLPHIGAIKEWLPEKHLDFIKNAPHIIVTNMHYFVHAGLAPNVAVAKQVPFDCVWIRDEFIQSSYDFFKTVVYGHTPTWTSGPSYDMMEGDISTRTPRKICLDGGCGKKESGFLNAAVFTDEKRTVAVKSYSVHPNGVLITT